MPGVAVQGLDAAGGVQLSQANPWYRIEGRSVVVIGDTVAAHGDPPHSPSPAMVAGESWYRVGGTPVCRAGHAASCGHATSGRGWYRIG